MTTRPTGTVLFGDVVDSGRDPGSTAWLRAIRSELDATFPPSRRLAPFAFTQGDELQGLLAPGEDPFAAVVRAALGPDARALRWAIVWGEVEPGTGPATERTGPAFRAAREVLAGLRARRDGLKAVTGDPAADALLDDLGPLLAALLDRLTTRQREVGRLLIIDELRQSEAAGLLGVSRATVSVMADRAGIRHLQRLARALSGIFLDGVARSARTGPPASSLSGAAR
jgi:predicted DNA-binding protein (UPF0251 family)